MAMLSTATAVGTTACAPHGLRATRPSHRVQMEGQDPATIVRSTKAQRPTTISAKLKLATLALVVPMLAKPTASPQLSLCLPMARLRAGLVWLLEVGDGFHQGAPSRATAPAAALVILRRTTTAAMARMTAVTLKSVRHSANISITGMWWVALSSVWMGLQPLQMMPAAQRARPTQLAQLGCVNPPRTGVGCQVSRWLHSRLTPIAQQACGAIERHAVAMRPDHCRALGEKIVVDRFT